MTAAIAHLLLLILGLVWLGFVLVVHRRTRFSGVGLVMLLAVYTIGFWLILVGMGAFSVPPVLLPS